jgi:hypothetical protein
MEKIAEAGKDYSWEICLCLLCITVIVAIFAWLINSGKVGTITWKKGYGFTYEKPTNNDALALMLTDKSIDEEESKFKRRMLATVFETFKDNRQGQEQAIRIIALNHCMRDIQSIGLSTHIADAKKIGGWSDEEAESFTQGLLVSGRKLIDARLDAYAKCNQFNTSATFRAVTNSKIEKNIQYSAMINRYLKDYGLKSEILDTGHEWRTKHLTRSMQEEAK